jgi:hypothetical protein
MMKCLNVTVLLLTGWLLASADVIHVSESRRARTPDSLAAVVPVRMTATIQREGKVLGFFRGFALANNEKTPVVYRAELSPQALDRGALLDSPFARLQIARADQPRLTNSVLGAGCAIQWVANVQAKSIYVINAEGNCSAGICPAPPGNAIADAFQAGRAMVGQVANLTCGLDGSCRGRQACKTDIPTTAGTQVTHECQDRGTRLHNCLAVVTMAWTGGCSCQ